MCVCMVRITNLGNSLPFSVVTAPSVNLFKNRLDKHWASQELRYDLKAELSGSIHTYSFIHTALVRTQGCVHTP